ncbi:MAG TPA: TetR/AcrR family transcriptional regulator, partial [Polyangiaceae bacterium]|nr:TetR/AcrR family transcriptional regulator [Polyangiaceae bacterium]
MSTLDTTADVTEAEKPEKADKAADWNNPRVASILAAAAKCFARKGFSATTLAEIGKELGLRKSIVHYYFASKAALIHEVQSYSQHKYLARVQDAIKTTSDAEPRQRLIHALQSLWEVLEGNRTAMHLNIEVWSASRRDPELQRRAALLQKDARRLISEGVADVLKIDATQFPQMRA